MSTMSIIKNKASIFDGYEFQHEPFESTDKFSVYIPKEKDTISQLIKKTQDPKYRENAFRSPFYSPKQTKERFFATEGDANTGSRFREKLEGDLIKAKLLENNEENAEKQQENASKHVNMAEESRNCGKSAGHLTRSLPPNKKKVVIKQLVDAKKIEKFKDSLYFDERTKTLPKTTIRNKVVEDLVNQYDSLMNNRNLLDYVYKIKSQNLLKNQHIKVEKNKGSGKFNFVYNDYHLRETNPGFARNKLGTFFTR